ncbi:universal stress protein [Chryseotalea sanaruensis]|uniref:Universal stress protein n=1 Tax=Chryseotalea sanaruensis TaxID=2482724 RepID=A0A401U692_9BACT|nr:universal stress protein [Chryseotalea sanaruensis]GCC50405.1 universal stress protein [Chryseotalea sanaruensis]
MKNILVPSDFSKPAEEAYKFAISIAGQSKGCVHVLHVIETTFLRGTPTLANSYTFSLNFIEEFEKEIDKKFQFMLDRLTPFTINVRFKHVISSLSYEIENYIAANKIDLVIMGTHSAQNITAGSKTEKIVRSSPVPVITLLKAPERITNIVFPRVPGQADDHFVASIKRMQLFFDAKIHLLHVNTPTDFKNDPDAESELNKFAIAKQFHNYTINLRSDFSIESGISQFAKDIKADMIVMGTHGRTGISHFFIGSTTEEIVNHEEIPIWTQALKT